MAVCLDGVEELQRVRLAVIGDEVIPGLLIPDGLNNRLACVNSVLVTSGEADGAADTRGRTCSADCIVVETGLANVESLPVLSIYPLIDVNDIEFLILAKCISGSSSSGAGADKKI